MHIENKNSLVSDLKLSIIIPVYNSEKYLDACVESVLLQKFEDYEIILVDDGSTDGSGLICDNYTDERIKVVHQENRGVSGARNKGIEIAQGEYVIFVDSDDWLDKHALSVLMEQKEFADLTFFGSTFHTPGQIARSYIPESKFYDSFAALQEGLVDLLYNPEHPDYVGFTWNKMFRNDIIRKYNVRFVEGLSLREDEIFTYTYACHCESLCTLSDIVYHYRSVMTGLTGLWCRKKSEEYLLLASEYRAAESGYISSDLCKYLNTRAAEFSFRAVRKAKTQDALKQAIDFFWDVYSQSNPKIRMKCIYRLLLKTKSKKIFAAYFLLKRSFVTLG